MDGRAALATTNPLMAALRKFSSLRAQILVTASANFRHCERSAAVHHRAPP
jgi:hypothetical protein